MAVNLSRVGAAGAVGIASGLVAKNMAQSLVVAGQSVSYAAISEIAATLGGAAMQFFSPFTMPDIVDGLVDGGIALLAKRATGNVLGVTRPWAGSPLNALGSPCASARGLFGSEAASEDRTKVV